ncbi:Oidioi.mRNA.OKI2018_I69.XSR.g16327.t2.cds [Oikopleura dioica]|uniref:Oidioi.mRNA.OKI2018_I69.XSR.g16327.t2.cds n=1 Tax=Oikopleura dioica TaxID=34765 RepID=A0ABN7SFQ6_OIKDI|nr:Oidioi.mRNA.OKI2018_I69.XSR.g16327.t2.cds [Oikopleura dioica]
MNNSFIRGTQRAAAHSSNALVQFERLGAAGGPAARHTPGQHFIHRKWGYRGVVLKSMPAERHKSKDKLPDVTKNCHVNLVLVDELDATGKYPSLALANLKVFNNGNLEPASHKHLSGGISCFDLVESEDIVPYRRPPKTISNSSLENFFNTYNVDAGLSMIQKNESAQVVLGSTGGIDMIEHALNENVRVITNTAELPALNISAKVTLTAMCLKKNPTGTTNWIITVDLEDTDSTIEGALIELTVIEESENTIRYRAEPHEQGVDSIHYARTIKLRHQSQVAFVSAKVTYRRSDFSQEIRMKSATAVLVGRRNLTQESV